MGAKCVLPPPVSRCGLWGLCLLLPASNGTTTAYSASWLGAALPAVGWPSEGGGGWHSQAGLPPPAPDGGLTSAVHPAIPVGPLSPHPHSGRWPSGSSRKLRPPGAEPGPSPCHAACEDTSVLGHRGCLGQEQAHSQKTARSLGGLGQSCPALGLSFPICSTRGWTQWCTPSTLKFAGPVTRQGWPGGGNSGSMGGPRTELFWSRRALWKLPQQTPGPACPLRHPGRPGNSSFSEGDQR